MLLSKLHRIQPCLLCNESKSDIARICYDCWSSLNWKTESIQRQGMLCFVGCSYTFPMKNIIHQFKDQSQLQYLELLSACLLEMPKPRIQAIIPMPISTEKLIERGYNQMLLIAQALSKVWNVPVWQPISRREGQSQKTSDWEERLSNINTQLYANTSDCKYKHVLMIDDVITTGASLAALKLQLEQLGCTHIHAASICDARIV